MLSPSLSNTYSSSLRQILLVAYAALLAMFCLLLAVSLLVTGQRLGNLYAVAALVVLAVFAERQSIRLTPRGPQGEGIEASVASLVFIFAGVVFGPLAAMVVGMAGLLVDFKGPTSGGWSGLQDVGSSPARRA